MKLQKFGGYAAIASVCPYLVIFPLYAVMQRRFGDLNDPMRAMDAYSAAPAYLNVCFLLFAACYIFCLVFVFALHERMQAKAPYLTRIMMISMSVAAAIGILEAVVGISSTGLIATTRDISAYRAFSALVNGMHFAGGHALAWACLFVGCAILKTRAFSRVLGWLFLLTGIFWIPRFMVPQLGVLPALMSCVAAIWIGFSLLRKQQPQPAAKEMVASR